MVVWLFILCLFVFLLALLRVDWSKEDEDLDELWMLEDDAEEGFDDKDN